VTGRTPTADPDALRRFVRAMEERTERSASTEDIAAAIDRMETARLRRERGL
jgi:hypothetical protein